MFEDFVKVFTEECEDKKSYCAFQCHVILSCGLYVVIKSFVFLRINVCILYECTVQCVPNFVK